MHSRISAFFRISVAALYIKAAAGIGNDRSGRCCSITPENCGRIIGNDATRIGIGEMSDNCIAGCSSTFDGRNCIGGGGQSCISYRGSGVNCCNSSSAGIIDNNMHCIKRSFFSICVAPLHVEPSAGISHNCSGRTCSVTPENCGSIIGKSTGRVGISKMGNCC